MGWPAEWLHLTNDPHLCCSQQVWSLPVGAALLGFAGWLQLRRTSEEASNRSVFQGATAFVALMGLLVLVVAVALWRQKRWAFGAGVSFSCSGST